MKDQWYGDNRDLVKWGALLRLAHEHRATRILQVAYYRSCEWPELEVDGRRERIPQAVLNHFRKIRRITKLVARARIEVLADLFDDRAAYMPRVLEAVARRAAGGPSIIFLDPDTGLQPAHPTLKHVLETELREIWGALLQGDVLVLYQHQTRRDGKPWIPGKLRQFEQALGLSRGRAKVARGAQFAKDVILLYYPKA